MNLIEEILMIIGTIMLPYGLYDIAKGEGDKQVKILLIAISLTLFIVEFLLVK
ncbi:MAG: hypothetical protein RXQ76_04195 [Acidianus sp.]